MMSKTFCQLLKEELRDQIIYYVRLSRREDREVSIDLIELPSGKIEIRNFTAGPHHEIVVYPPFVGEGERHLARIHTHIPPESVSEVGLSFSDLPTDRTIECVINVWSGMMECVRLRREVQLPQKELRYLLEQMEQELVALLSQMLPDPAKLQACAEKSSLLLKKYYETLCTDNLFTI